MEVLQQVLQQLINGISLGSIYALIALGYTMIYGIIKLINFAHGDIYMVGAYIGFFAITQAHLSIVPSLLISFVVTGCLGMVIEKLAYKPLRHAPRISVLITAIGVSFFLEYTSMYFVSPTPRTFPAMFGDVAVSIGGIVINGQQMLILGITAVLMIVLTYIVQKTKTGKAMRAASFDVETAGRARRRLLQLHRPSHGHHAGHESVRRGCSRWHRHPAGRCCRRPDPRHRRGARLGLHFLDVP